MPIAKVEAQTTDKVDRWAAALPGAVEPGLEQAAGIIRDEARASLDANADPWGSAFPVLSPTTIHFYATEGDPRGSIGPGLRAVVENGRRGVVRATGRARRYAHVKQFGNPNNRMFNNSGLAPIPARPFLPLRPSGAVELPPAVNERVLAAIHAGLVQAMSRGGR